MASKISQKEIQQQEVAQNLFDQLKMMKAHGFPLLRMVAAKNFVSLDGDDGGLQFAVRAAGKENSRKINKVVIKYDYGADLYNLEFWHIDLSKDFDVKQTFAVDSIDVEQLYHALVGYVVDGEPLPIKSDNYL